MKKKNIFNVGDKVVSGSNGMGIQLVYSPNYGVEIGKIIEVLPNNMLKILWEENFFNVKTYSTSGELIFEPVIISAKNVVRLSESKVKFSLLEKEYKNTEKEIKERLKEAAKIIKESNKLAQKIGCDSLNDLYSATKPLFNVMNSCGWRTSSFNC